MTRSRRAIHVDESEAEKKMEEHKQQLSPNPALEPVSNFVELEEINKEVEDDKVEETPIKEKEKEKKLKNWKHTLLVRGTTSPEIFGLLLTI